LAARWVPTDVNALIHRELDGIRGRIEEKKLTVRTELAVGLGSLVLDSGLTRRLVEELLDNAVKFAPHGGVVVVATTATGGGLRREHGRRSRGPGDDGGSEGELRPLLRRPPLLRGLLQQLLCPLPAGEGDVRANGLRAPA